MKKTVALILASLMLVTCLSSCKKASDDEDGDLKWDAKTNSYVLEDEILNGSQSLKIWLDNAGFADAIIEGFKTMYPDVNIEVQSVIPQDSVNKMVLEGEAGTGADIFFIPHDHVGRAYSNSVLGMMGRYEESIRERFLESAVNTVDIDGTLYGVPYLTESIAFYYNKTILNDLHAQGVIPSAEPARNWEEIIALAKTYNDTRTNTWTIRWQVEEPYYDYMFLTAFGYELFGPDRTDPDSIGFDTPEALEGIRYFKKLREVWNINSGDSSWDVTTIEFAKGKTPYLISGPWSIENARTGAEENNFEFGVTTIPLMDGRQPYTFAGINVICVSPYSKYPGAARALAMYMASEEMLSYVYEKMGKIPALNDTYAANIKGLKDDMDIRGFMAQAEYSNAMPSIPEISFYWTTAKTMFTSVWDDVLSPEEAVTNAYSEYNTLRSSAK